MPRRTTGPRPHRITPRTPAPDADKALSAQVVQNLGGQVRTADQINTLLAQQALRAGQARALPRDEYPYQFGPDIPLVPQPLDPTRPDSGRAEPRLWEYPVSWNLPGVSAGRIVPWRLLRDAAEMPIVREAIRIRKDEVAGLEWDITLSPRAVEQAQRDDPSAARLDIEAQLREKLAPEIERVRAFWRMPDKGNGYTMAEWLSQFLEEHLVLDAVPIYPRKTLAGDLFSLEIVDGSTIKPLLDHRGGRPLPPQPAYQQIIYGFPRGEFTADSSDADGLVIPNAYAADQMIYIRREVRVASPYGLSAVEACLLDLDLWQKRVGWLRSEYSDGVMPAGWFLNKQVGDAAWQPSQVAEYEATFNDVFAGNTAQRMRYRFLPPGIEPAQVDNDIAEKFKPEFDLHLLKLVAMHFSVTVHEFGFTEAHGLGSSGHAKGQKDLNERKGRVPTLRWLMSIFSDISYAHLAMPDALEFTFLGVDDKESDGDGETIGERVASGRLTINEARDEEGRPRYSFPEADKPALMSSTGVLTFLEGSEAKQDQAAQDQRDASAAQLATLNGNPATQGQDPGAGQDPAPGGAGSDEDEQQAQKAVELAAFKRWARRTGGRRFVAKHLTSSDLAHHGIDPERVELAGDGLGKAAAGPEWPGWGRDRDIIATGAARIRDAVLHAIDVAAIATAWIAYVQGQQAVDADPAADVALDAAVTWLSARVLAGLVRALTAPLADLLAAAWSVGDTSSRQVLGDDAAVPEPGPTDTSHADDRAQSAAQGYVERLAGVLDQHDAADPPALTAELTGVLDDEATAQRIASDETTGSISTAAETNYASHGVEFKRWLIAPDQNVCPVCRADAEQGPVPVGDEFVGGVAHPPQHPNCRCAVVPVVEGHT